MRAPLLALALLAAPACVTHVFNEPVTLSTKSIVAAHARPIEDVSTEYTNAFFVILPIPSDPRDPWDRLVEEGRNAGGDVVLDVELRSKSFLGFIPLFWIDTWELAGTAARMR